MISTRLKGGIGNMMFQIAFVEYEGKRNKFETGYWNIDKNLAHLNNEKNHNPKLNHASEYLTIFKNFAWPKLQRPPGPMIDCNEPFTYQKINIQDNKVYDGFFQSELYFPDISFIWNLFAPSEHVKSACEKYKHLLNDKTCSIHIRRGDFLKFGLHYERDRGYYQTGIEAIPSADNYLIFSDDIPWCKQNFHGEEFTFIENEKDYVELFLQSQCHHNIISSSTFSWWAAYLNQHPDKIVVGPKQWFANGKANNIVPEAWKKI